MSQRFVHWLTLDHVPPPASQQAEYLTRDYFSELPSGQLAEQVIERMADPKDIFRISHSFNHLFSQLARR